MKLFRLFGLEDRISEIEDTLNRIDIDTQSLINKEKYDSHYWIYKNGDEFSILGTEYLVVDTYLGYGQAGFIYLVYDKTKKHTETWTEQELKNLMFTDEKNK
tara:strand:- start:3242 stop:3547 length:306 start_codon:yes stop_codon:yes gene_type:complete